MAGLAMLVILVPSRQRPSGPRPIPVHPSALMTLTHKTQHTDVHAHTTPALAAWLLCADPGHFSYL